MDDPFTKENHLEFIAERKRIDAALHEGSVTRLYEDPNVRALDRMLRLKKKYNNDMDRVQGDMGNAQYNIAENEFVARAGDPNRFNEDTGGWVIWP